VFAGFIHWLAGRRKRRREQILSEPLPESWLAIVRRSALFYERLPEDQQRRLCEHTLIFVAEKQFLGCAGLTITDEIKVTIAAGACVLLLGVPHLDVFPRLREVIVHPHDLTDTVDAVGPDGRRYAIRETRSGEAWRRGPVLLAWDSVRHSVARPHDGYNVVLHEFAHVLDMQSGSADGMPPLESREQYKTWNSVFYKEFDAFVEASRRGRSTFLDPYGASHPAEFFAVATEHFFEQSRRLKQNHPRLFRLLADFYHQDPTRRGRC
jgi:Mlc titration factor MtfA (ptsG expression regulator)